MKTKVNNLGYWIINVIGEILITLAQFIKILRSFLIATLIFAIILGVFFATTISCFALIGDVFNLTPDAELNIPETIFSFWYWNLIIFVIGSATIIFGMKNIFN